MLLNISCTLLLYAVVMNCSKSFLCCSKSKLYIVLEVLYSINEDNYIIFIAHMYPMHQPAQTTTFIEMSWSLEDTFKILNLRNIKYTS
jgi:hypothetical protein